jgi:hypothetical protein
MGVEFVRACERRGSVTPVAAIVTDARKAGVDLGTIAGLSRRLGAPASLDVDATLGRDDVDMVFYTGAGSSADVASALGRALDAGKDAITFSGLAHPATAIGAEAAEELDARARRAGRRALCTGFAPGFMPDVVPVVLASSAMEWTRIETRMVMKMDTWGPATLDAYGIGSPPGRHEPIASRLSFAESIGMIAEALRIELVSAGESWDPILSMRRRRGADREVADGDVTGVRRLFTAAAPSGRTLQLEITTIYELDEAVDGMAEEYAVEVFDHSASVARANLSGAWSPDPYPATAASGLNAIPGLLSLPPGLYNAAQIPFAAPTTTWRSLRDLPTAG